MPHADFLDDLQLGSKGDAVKLLQERLALAGFAPGYGADGKFGTQTLFQVRKFQEAVKLPPSGLVGHRTWSALLAMTDSPPPGQRASLTDFQAAFLAILVAENGVREIGGANRGPRVNEYLASVGLKPGTFWCQAFVYWGGEEAGALTRIKNPLPRTGSTQEFLRECKKRGWLVPPGAPLRPADIAVIRHDEDSGHVYVIKSTTSAKGPRFVESVEGNTNNNGSSNGDGVYIRNNRDPRDAAGIIRIPV